MDESIRQAAAKAILDKAAQLQAERGRLRHEMDELSRQVLKIDQELADCRSAARVFGAELPTEEKSASSASTSSLVRLLDLFQSKTAVPDRRPSAEEPKEMPKIKDIVLERLKAAGPAGTKASAIREYIDVTYGAEIHEKTVGMSLFRLAKRGLAHRKGITWIFGPDPSGTKNPGEEAPGSVDDLV